MTLHVQFMTLMLMAGCGVALGVCFDTIGAASREFRFHRALQALIDLAYWGAATALVFRVLLHVNDGQLRAFVYIGLALGALLYFWLLGAWTRHLIGMLLRLFKRIFRFTVRFVHAVIVRPLLFIYRVVARIITAVFGFILRASVFLGKVVVQWARLVWKWIRKRQ